MKKIPLTRGEFALVDDEDFEELNKHKWCCYLNPYDNNRKYAVRNKYLGTKIVDGKKKKINRQIRMHRVIAKPTKGKIVDHKNGNGLDNRKNNLRIATYSQNLANSNKPSTNTTGYKGVNHKPYISQKKPWVARIGVGNKEIHIGCFKTKTKAIEAYNETAKAYFGDFAKLNDINAS